MTDKLTRLSVLGRFLPRYIRSTSGRGFSWEELEEVDLRYRARASSIKYDRKNRTRGYDRTTTIARL
jgi:ribosomal protein L13E